MLGDVEVELGVDFFANREELEASAEKVVFTGMIDQYFDYKHGELEYRSLRFEHEVLDEENHQGNAVVNYTEREIPYTRIIEHKHFEYGTQPKTVITREYPADWKRGDEPYYPMMKRTMPCLLSTKKKLRKMTRLSSVDVLQIINTTTCTW